MASIISQQHDVNQINFVAGLSDPGEMIACGFLPQIRRQEGEQDAAYAQRILPIVMALPREQRDRIMGAAVRRAGLDTSNGRVNVVVAGEPAWHGLGVNVSEAMTTAQCLELSGQDFTVELWPTAMWDPEDPAAPYVDMDEQFATVRTDTKQRLSRKTISGGYKVLQNVEAFNFLDELVGAGEAHWETAGCLGKHGEKVWIMARLPHDFEVVPGDEVHTYAAIYHGHDGVTAINVFPTSNRIVCQNTANVALSKAEKRKLVIRHTGSLTTKVQDARDCLGLVGRKIDQFRHQSQALAAVSLKDSQVTEYFEQFFPTKVRPQAAAGIDGASLLESILDADGQEQEVVKDLLAGHFADNERQQKRNAAIMEQLLETYHSELPGVRGTAWAAFNSVTNHLGKKDYRSDDSRLSSIWFGSSDQTQQAAFSAALNLATK